MRRFGEKKAVSRVVFWRELSVAMHTDAVS